MRVSVRTLKEHLSHYLRVVQAGEAVVVTSHGKPIVRVEPLAAPRPDDAMERLAGAAAVQWKGGKPAGARVALVPGPLTASDLVLEDRR